MAFNIGNTPSATNRKSIYMIQRFAPAILAVLFTGISALAQQKTVTVATGEQFLNPST